MFFILTCLAVAKFSSLVTIFLAVAIIAHVLKLGYRLMRAAATLFFLILLILLVYAKDLEQLHEQLKQRTTENAPTTSN
jgi:hypothetical protein